MVFYIIILLLLGLLTYQCYWKPKKLHQKYVESFRKQGYKVLEIPFRPLALTFLEIYDFTETTTDAFKVTKEKYPGHDVVVMNIANIISLDLINPELVQELLAG